MTITGTSSQQSQMSSTPFSETGARRCSPQTKEPQHEMRSPTSVLIGHDPPGPPWTGWIVFATDGPSP